MQLGDLVSERKPPFLISTAEFGLVIRELGDKWYLVLWDDGVKRKCFATDLLIISTTWSLLNDYERLQKHNKLGRLAKHSKNEGLDYIIKKPNDFNEF